MGQKDYPGAARIYKDILHDDPNSFEALNNLGVVEAQMGHYTQAAKAYEQALSLQPRSFPLLLNLGLSYFKAGNFGSAVKPLEQAVSVQPDSFQVRSLLAMSYYSQKEFELASRLFEKLIAAEPDNSALQYLLAESYLWSEQNQELLDFFRRVLERSPNSVSVHMLMGEANDGLGRTSDAIREFEVAAAIAPDQPNVHFGLGYLYWKDHQYDKASDQFTLEIQKGGSVEKSEAYLGDIALRQEKPDQARDLLERAIRSYPKLRIAHYDLGVLYTREKKYGQAESEFREAIDLDPERADAHYRLAEVFRRRGKEALAREELNKVTEIHQTERDKLLHEISGPGSQAPISLRAQITTEERVRNPSWWPTQGVPLRAEYLGPEVCAECHPSEAAGQRTTAMAHAAAQASDSNVLRARDWLSFHFGPYSYRIARAAKGSVYSVSDGNRTISEQLLWAFGVGEVGQTYVLVRNGSYYESRVSYYSAIQSLDLTTGHPRSAPAWLDDAVGRSLDATEVQRCFGCHTTASTTGNRFDLSRLIPGITCEACHGPGAKHVSAMKAGRVQRSLILSPARLNVADSVDFCGACHRTWWDVKLMGVVGVSNVRFQPYRLENSRCWGKGDARITCVSCHDPHYPLQRDSASYDERCLRCHLGRPGAKPDREHPGAACPMSTRNCVSCHMPKVELPEMHFKFTDHQIRVVREAEAYPN